MADNLSVLGKARKAYQPKLPAALRDGALKVTLNKGSHRSGADMRIPRQGC